MACGLPGWLDELDCLLDPIDIGHHGEPLPSKKVDEPDLGVIPGGAGESIDVSPSQPGTS